MNILLFVRLPHYRTMLIGILFIIVAESFVGGISIAMLIPIFNVLMGNAGGAISGLPSFICLYIEQVEPAWVFFGFGVILLGKSILGLGREVIEGHLLRKLRHEWTLNLSKKSLLEPYSESEGIRIGHALNIASREILRASNYVTAVLTFLSSCAYVLVITVTAAVINWKLMLATSVLLLILYITVFRHVVAYSRENGGRTLRMVQDLMAEVNENLSNRKEIKILNIEYWRMHLIERRSREVGRQEMRYAFIQGLPVSINEALFAFAAIGFGAALMLGWRPDPKQFLTLLPFFTIAAYKIVTAVAALASHRIKAINRESSFESVCDLALIQHENFEDGLSVDVLTTSISLMNVYFSYPDGTRIFAGFESEIETGKIIFLKGRSGTGKSTLLDLLIRMREVERGAIIANGEDIRSFKLKNWRRLFGYVGQDPHLFYGTIFENIALDKPVTDEDVSLASRLAGIDQFIESLPDRYHSVVGERGLNLSGGQRRRIALARVLVRNPQVIMLDETTSAFESSLEREILLRLRAVGSITVIVVSHRGDNMDLADRIIDMDEAIVAT